MKKGTKGRKKTGQDLEKGTQRVHLNRPLSRIDSEADDSHDRKKGTQKPLPKTYTDYWRSRLKRRTSSNGREIPYWQVRVKFRNRQVWFNTQSANVEVAARKARDFWVLLQDQGLEEALRRFKPEAEEQERVATTGEFLAEAEKFVTCSPKTFADYARAFRRIVAGVTKMDSDSSRFDHRGGGSAIYKAKIDAVPLKMLTPEKVIRWRREFVSKRGTNPRTRKAAEISAASFIRQAKALFRAEIIKFVECGLPNPLPFDGVPIRAPRAERYQSEATAEHLFTAAVGELKGADPEAFKAFLLCLAGGLRRGEADALLWKQVDLDERILNVTTTPYFHPKTPEAERRIDLDETTASLLQGLKAQSGAGPFVLAGNKPRNEVTDRRYRAQKTWKRLEAWLKNRGLTGKVIHKLRKEGGSLVNDEFGLEEARNFLGHASVSVTSAHYIGKRRKVAVKLGSVEGPTQEAKG